MGMWEAEIATQQKEVARLTAENGRLVAENEMLRKANTELALMAQKPSAAPIIMTQEQAGESLAIADRLGKLEAFVAALSLEVRRHGRHGAKDEERSQPAI